MANYYINKCWSCSSWIINARPDWRDVSRSSSFFFPFRRRQGTERWPNVTAHLSSDYNEFRVFERDIARRVCWRVTRLCRIKSNQKKRRKEFSFVRSLSRKMKGIVLHIGARPNVFHVYRGPIQLTIPSVSSEWRQILRKSTSKVDNEPFTPG